MGISITESDDSDSLFLNFSENGSKKLQGILIRTKKSQYLNKVERGGRLKPQNQLFRNRFSLEKLFLRNESRRGIKVYISESSF